jgi:hypothetical protein
MSPALERVLRELILPFVVALALGVAVSGALAIRRMRRMKISPAASAQRGYVELAGTLHLPPHADAVIGPLSKLAGVWYARETNLGSKGSRTCASARPNASSCATRPER